MLFFESKEYKLIKAVKSDNFPAVQKLLSKGANPYKFCKENMYKKFTPFFYSCAHGSLRMTKLLYDTRKTNMSSALIDACGGDSFDKYEIIEFLIKNGADVNYDNGDETPLRAILDGMDLLDLKTESEFIIAAKAFGLFINNGADIKNSLDKYFILHCAVANHSHEVCKILLDAGADINQKDQFGDSPIMWLFGVATKDDKILISRAKTIIRFFIERGADLNIRNNDGKTIFDIIEEENEQEYLPLLKKEVI